MLRRDKYQTFREISKKFLSILVNYLSFYLRTRDLFILLIHSSNACISLGWDRLKPGARNSSAASQGVCKQEAGSLVQEEPGLEPSTHMWDTSIPSGNLTTVLNAYPRILMLLGQYSVVLKKFLSNLPGKDR